MGGKIVNKEKITKNNIISLVQYGVLFIRAKTYIFSINQHNWGIFNLIEKKMQIGLSLLQQ
jgi:hypothetical protein